MTSVLHLVILLATDRLNQMLSANTWIINIHNFEFSETLCLLSSLDHLDLGLRFSSKIPLSVIIWNILPGKTPFLRISRQNFQLLSWFLSPVDRLNQKQLLFTILLNLCLPLYYFFFFRWKKVTPSKGHGWGSRRESAGKKQLHSKECMRKNSVLYEAYVATR